MDGRGVAKRLVVLDARLMVLLPKVNNPVQGGRDGKRGRGGGQGGREGQRDGGREGGKKRGREGGGGGRASRVTYGPPAKRHHSSETALP